MNHEELLNPIRTQVDRVMVVVAGLLFIETIITGLVYENVHFALLIGLPALVIPLLIWRTMPGTLMTRLFMASSFVIQIAAQIQITQGMIEMHFGVFVALAFLMAYRDWRPIVFAAALVAVHHLACNYLQAAQLGVWVFRSGPNLGIVLLHAAYVVFESVILVFLANQLRKNAIESATVAILAERIADGNLKNDMGSFAIDSAHGMLHSMKIMQDSLVGLLREIEMVVDVADHGDFSKKINLINKQGFGKTIGEMLNQLLETTEVGLNDVMRVTNALAAGDLSQKITKDYPGVFGLTKTGVNNTVDSLAKVMSEVQTITDAAANQGNFSQKINMSDKIGYTYTLADLLNQLTTLTETGLRDILRVADAMAQGELTEEINNNYPGLFGQTKDGINTTVENLKTMVGEIKATTDIISVAAREIAAGNNDLSNRTEKQAASLEMTASSMSELTSTVEKNTRNAQQASQLAVDASEIAAKGVYVVDRVVATMDDINKSSLKIGDIISVIDDIAFQTNILSLNAAVEAARAGERGKGFAVVAIEVRNLAQRAATAAGEIKSLIQDSVSKVQEGTKLVANAGQTMKEIVGSIEKVTLVMTEISAASIEQMSGIQQVNQAINQMDDVTQQNAALVEQAAAAAESLEEQTQQLSATVSNFKF